MATSEAGMTSEQEMTDTAEEGETPLDTSDPHSPFRNSEDSNSTHNETEETESAVSTDRDNWSTTSNTPTVPTTTTPTPSTPTTPITPAKKDGFPNRPGIQWKKGERVEAMDYLNKWYPAKIMDIDEEEKAVLIHFEGWNQRYDEWTLMSSEGIRPLTRHSERKDRGKKNVKEFRAGEKVLAKWTDCKMYPAKVSAVNANGSLEVMFYDGFVKTVQPINVKALQGKALQSARNIKKPLKQEYERRGRRPGSGKSRSSSVEEKEGKGGLAERRHKHKLIVAGSFLAKRERSHSAPSLSERQKKSEVRRRGFGMRSSPVKSKKEMSLRTSPGQSKKTAVPRLSPAQTKKDSRSGETAVKRARKRALSLPAKEGSPGLKSDPQTPSSAPAVPSKRAKSTEKDKSNLVGGLAPKEFVIEADHNLFKCMITGCTKSFRKENLLDYHIKYYHTQDGHTPQHPASRTKRRKTSSICSTDSDISVSSKGKTTPGEGSASKRKRHISSASDVLKEESIDEIKKEEVTEEEEKAIPSTPVTPATPVTLGTPLAVDAGRTPGGDTSGIDEKGQEETEDELAGDEVVNCVCGFNEENGLMIQCDVCLCWQHATCFSIKQEALPSKYICFVCENPPGIRDSRRYIHDQDWFKSGQLPTFSFLDVKQSEDSCDTVKATHSLIADVLNVKAVLHSLKQEIKAPSNKNHREMKTWKRICEERRRKSRAAETRSVAHVSVSSVVTSAPDQDEPTPAVSKTDPTAEEVQETKPMVKFCLDSENPDELQKDIKEESPISKSMGCQASLDLSGSSLDRSDDKSFDMSVADNDSDTSTMTASESSVGYSSSFPSGPSGSGLGADDTNTFGETDGRERKMEGEMHKLEGGNHQVPMSMVEDDPADEIQFEDCERSLLLHIVKVQSELYDRLDLIEEQVIALEKADPNQSAPPVPPAATQGATPTPAKSILRDVPVLKRSLHTLIRDLGKVKSMAAYH